MQADSLTTGLPCGSGGKESACDAGDLGSIPGLGRSPGEGKSYPLQYSGLENSMDCTAHEVAKSRTGLNNFHFQFLYQLSYQGSPKENELRRIEAFELWCWRRLLRVPWTAKSSYQSILKEISPEYSLEGLLLKLQHFGHLMQRTDSLEKTLMLGKIEGRRRRGQQRMRWLDGITNSMDMSLSNSRSW